ncbi:molybdenum cofactor guanylyltransferase MobA [Faunimonas pinastri]|nr:molybdenum cofactor guanylyltransferase MobA [Faunimonas pinastri]
MPREAMGIAESPCSADISAMTNPSTAEQADAKLPVAGIILAGGLSRRMGGGDKPLLSLAGRSMLARAVTRLREQVDCLAINANGDPARFAEFGLPVIPDTLDGNLGPLAGILAGMRWAVCSCPRARFMVSAAADTPFFPGDLVCNLGAGCGRDEDTVAMAASPAGTHPVFALWPIALADELEAFLKKQSDGAKILSFADRYLRINVPFDNIRAGGIEVDPFFNVNTPEDAEEAASIARTIDT